MISNLKKYSSLLIAILAIIASVGISMSFNFIDNQFIFKEANSFVWILLACFYYIIINSSFKIKDKRLHITTLILSVIISITVMVGYIAEEYFVTGEILKISKKSILFFMWKFLTCIVSLHIVFTNIFYKVSNFHSRRQGNVKAEWKIFTNNKLSIFAVTIFIFVLYIPYLLRFFPGIASADPMQQIMQMLGIYELSNHHPVLHSAIALICMKIGYFISGSYNIGILVYSILQLLITALSFSFVLYYMAKRKVSRIYRIIALGIFALFPLFPIFGITVQKDILFAISILLLTICIIDMLKEKNDFFAKKTNYIWLFATILGTMFFRNNGIYVIILLFPILLFVLRKFYKQIVCVFSIGIILYFSVTNYGYNAMGIKKGSAGEALSIPLQLFARLYQNRIDELSEEDKSEINKYLPVENLGSLYNPRFSDGVKRYFSQEAFKEDSIGIVKLYVKLVLKFPDQAVISFICNSYGYYYPDTIGWGVYTEIIESDLECEKELGWKQEPIVQNPIIDKAVYLMNNKQLPIVSMIFSIGFVFWMILTCMAYTIYKKEYKKLLMFAPVLLVWFTSLASPVYGETRYVYSMFMCLPVFVIMSINTENTKWINKYKEKINGKK